MLLKNIKLSRLQPILGGLMILLAGLVFWLSVVRLDFSQTAFYNLAPNPDASEYLDGAVSLIREGSHHIHLGDGEYPSRYPPGYSLLLAPFVTETIPTVRTPFVANRYFSALMLLLVVVLVSRSAGFFSAGLTCLLLATQPSFITFARSPMSEIAAGVLLLGSFFSLARYLKEGGTWAGVLGALFLGLSCCIRSAFLLFLPVLLGAAWYHFFQNSVRRTQHLAWMAAGFLVGLFPVLVHNFLWFGSPFANGYSYWLGTSPAFSFIHVPATLSGLWAELTLQSTRFSTADIYGTGRYFGPALVLSILLAAFLSRRSQRFWVLAIACVPFAVFLLGYEYANGRQFWPLILAGVVLAGVKLGNFLTWKPVGHPALVTLVLALLACTAADFPDNAGGSGLLAGLNLERLQRSAATYQALQTLEQTTRPGDLVFTDIVPTYLHALSSKQLSVYPFQDRHAYSTNPAIFHLEASARTHLTSEALKNGSGIFLLTLGTPLALAKRYLPLPLGFAWTTVNEHSGKGGLARATPSARETVQFPEPFLEPLKSETLEGISLVANGILGPRRLVTEFLIVSTEKNGEVVLETFDSTGTEMAVGYVSGESSSHFRSRPEPLSIVRRSTSGTGPLRIGRVRVRRSRGIELVTRLTVLDEKTRNTLEEVTIPLRTPSPTTRANFPNSPGLDLRLLPEILRSLVPFSLRTQLFLNQLVSEIQGDSILPRFIDGIDGKNHYQTLLSFSNTGPATSFSIEFLDARGVPTEVSLENLGADSRFLFSLPEAATIRLETPGNGAVHSGYVRIRSEGTILAEGGLRSTSDTGPLWEVAVPALSQAGHRFAFLADTTGLRETYFSVVNPSQVSDVGGRAAQITLRFYSPSGKLLESHETRLPETQQMENSVQSLFAEAEEQMGIVTIESDQPLSAVAYGFVSALDGGSAGLVPYLYWLPIIPLAESEGSQAGAGERP